MSSKNEVILKLIMRECQTNTWNERDKCRLQINKETLVNKKSVKYLVQGTVRFQLKPVSHFPNRLLKRYIFNEIDKIHTKALCRVTALYNYNEDHYRFYIIPIEKSNNLARVWPYP